jgi:DNA-directed RNA polymerase I, II, and III subunit RPABC2
MSDESDYYDSNSESDEEIVGNVVLTKKPNKPIVINHAKQFGGYEEDESVVDDSEPDDADGDDDDNDDDELIEGADDETEGDIKDDAENDSADDDSDIEIDEDGQAVEKNTNANKSAKPKKTTQIMIDEDEDEDDDDYDENYLKKFDNEVNKSYIYEFHPECLNHNKDEVEKLSKVVRDENNIIIDPLHRTLPYLTKYEKARVLGQRAKQIEVGSTPFVKVPENIIDGYVIAELELREKKIPFIIKRPIPSGAFEYWHLRDLENINF